MLRHDAISKVDQLPRKVFFCSVADAFVAARKTPAMKSNRNFEYAGATVETIAPRCRSGMEQCRRDRSLNA
jgi:hypothetical protein